MKIRESLFGAGEQRMRREQKSSTQPSVLVLEIRYGKEGELLQETSFGRSSGTENPIREHSQILKFKNFFLGAFSSLCCKEK